jgi:hypothetical protein
MILEPPKINAGFFPKQKEFRDFEEKFEIEHQGKARKVLAS